MNYALTEETLALVNALNKKMDYLICSPSRQYVNRKHFNCKLTFNSDFMKNKELSFNDFRVIKNDFGQAFTCWCVTLFVRIS